MKLWGLEYRQDKGYRTGTHRSHSPRETFEKYRKWLAPMGITRLANVTGLDRIGMPVYVAIRPNSRSLATSQGKGADLDSARASAMMESIETWHGERIELRLRSESYVELCRTENVVEIDRLPLRAGAVLRKDVPMLWLEGWDLLGGGPKWVPYETISTNFVKAGRTHAAVFFESTNGLASGNHVLEATVHSLCEVIERDAVSLFFVEDESRSKERQLDLATVDDPCCRTALAQLAAAGVEVAAWNITSDVGIPTYAATIIEGAQLPRWRAMGAFAGYGTHLSPGVALMRAISEAIQSRLTMISGSRDDLLPRDYADCSNPDDQRRMLEAHRAPPPCLSFRAQEDLSTDTFEDDIELLLAGLRRVGVDSAVVVDLRKPDIGIPVVKSVVPGLEGVALARTYQPGQRAAAVLAKQSGGAQ